MVVTSMTGFVRQRYSLGGVAYTSEVRTLNHKYLDIHCKLPETLSVLEMPLRNMLKKYINRGRVDVRVSREQDGGGEALTLNEPVYGAYCKIIADIGGQHALGPLDPVALLTLPNILRGEEVASDSIVEPFLAAFAQSLQALQQDRRREGSILWQDMLTKLERIRELAAELEALAPEQQREVGLRFRQRLARLDESPEDSRIMAEIAILIDKSDINEELVRLKAHLQEFIASGTKGEAIGRRLEFLGQEMLRETNTIGAKSAVYQVSKLAVDIKTELEKVREQVQNIE